MSIRVRLAPPRGAASILQPRCVMRTTVSRSAWISLLLAGALGPATLQGQAGAKGNGAASDAAAALRLSTLGVGFELGKQFMDHVSARVGINHRAIGIEVDDGLLWTWIGPHDEYVRLLNQ